MHADDRHSTAAAYQIRQCLGDDCRFRFPAPADSQESMICPKCHGPAAPVGELFVGRNASKQMVREQGVVLEALLDNVRSSHNVGSIFRSCDGAGVRRLHLCGITSTPDQGKVSKAALGAEVAIPWTYHRNGLDAVHSCRNQGYSVWSLENRESSQSIFELNSVGLTVPTLLVVGNELAGVDPGILELSHRTVSIPMMGHKGSLNAAVAFGIVAYWLIHGVMRQGERS